MLSLSGGAGGGESGADEEGYSMMIVQAKITEIWPDIPFAPLSHPLGSLTTWELLGFVFFLFLLVLFYYWLYQKILGVHAWGMPPRKRKVENDE